MCTLIAHSLNYERKSISCEHLQWWIFLAVSQNHPSDGAALRWGPPGLPWALYPDSKSFTARGTWINIQEGLIIFEIFTQYDPKLLLTWTSKTFRLKIMFTLKILLYSNCNLLWYNNTYLVISIRNYAYEFNWSTILGIYKFHFFPDDKRQDEKSHFMH